MEKAQKEYENSIKICEKVIHNAKISESNPLVSDEENKFFFLQYFHLFYYFQNLH